MTDAEHDMWLRDTWRMIEHCGASHDPMLRAVLTPAGCLALIEQRKQIDPSYTGQTDEH